MALNKKVLATNIVNKMLKGKKVDKDTKKTMVQSWELICGEIITHFQQEGIVYNLVPFAANKQVSEMRKNPNTGLDEEVDVGYLELEGKIK